MKPQLSMLLETLRTALTDGATEQERAEGLTAMETVQTLFGATPGQPLVAQAPVANPLAAVQQLQQASPSVVLDVLIAKLKSYLPEEAQSPPPGPALNVPFIRIPPGIGGSAGSK